MFLTAIWNLNILQVSHTHRNPNRARRFHVIDRKYRSKVVPRLYPCACAISRPIKSLWLIALQNRRPFFKWHEILPFIAMNHVEIISTFDCRHWVFFNNDSYTMVTMIPWGPRGIAITHAGRHMGSMTNKMVLALSLSQFFSDNFPTWQGHLLSKISDVFDFAHSAALNMQIMDHLRSWSIAGFLAWFFFIIKPIKLGSNVGITILFDPNPWFHDNHDTFFFIF